MEIKVAATQQFSSALIAVDALSLNNVTVKREGTAPAPQLSVEGDTLSAPNVILRYLGNCAPNSDLYGDLNVADKAQVDAWLEWSANELKDVKKAVSTLEGHLTSREFMVGTKPSLADVHIVCEILGALVNDDGLALDQMPIKAEWVLGQWIQRCAAGVPALGTSLTGTLDGLRGKVAELKKEKQSFQNELLRMQKMKAILGDDKKPPAASSGGGKKAAVSPPATGGLPPVEENPTEEKKEVDEEKEAKKAAKKAAKEAEKAAKAERKKAEEERKKGKKSGPAPEYRLSKDFVEKALPYGNIFIQSDVVSTGRAWRQLGSFKEGDVGKDVWLRCRVHNSRIQGKRSFLIIRQNLHLMQCMVDPETIDKAFPEPENASEEQKELGKKVVGFAKDLTNESVVDILAELTVPPAPIQSDILTIKQYELQVKKLYCVSKAKELPFQLADASRSATELAANGDLVQVHLETRLNNRIVDLRTRANQGIFRIQSGVCTFFREFLLSEGFMEIHSPKMLAGGSEGGAEVFRVDYFPKYGLQNAFLAQSPQLYKQMALMCDFPKVFEVGPVFRSEDSFTHRHMTEFMGLDMEMHFVEHYHEVLDVLDRCFRHIFNSLNTKCKSEIEAVRQQYPFADMLYNQDSPCKIFTFKEAVDLLRAEGPAVAAEQIASYEKQAAETNDAEEKTRLWDVAEKAMEHKATLPTKAYLEDVSTKDEKILGEVVKRKFGTEFYIIDKFPAAVRPFYTMPDPAAPEWSNSYDIFMRGEEIMSGAQRIHDPELLVKLAKEKDMTPDQYYTESFSMGAFPHAGGGVGLERVVMLFLGLDNIRRTSLFPRDPKRLAP